MVTKKQDEKSCFYCTLVSVNDIYFGQTECGEPMHTHVLNQSIFFVRVWQRLVSIADAL